MSKAPVSLCLMVKNEPLLETCLQSIRDHVEEIVIVDTGSNDGTTVEVAKKYADIFEVFTDCNDPTTGLIEDFSKARQRSFNLSTKPWVLWMDSDDIIEGGENLIKIISSFRPLADNEAVSFLFPYEYSYDMNGKCTCRHYRERLISNKNHFHWRNPVHEVLCVNDGVRVQLISDDSLLYKHRRQYSNKPVESGRNLRILKKYVEGAGKDDARQMYYIGLEYYNNGLVPEALGSLTKYIEISGWDDERVMACLKLVDIYQGMAQYQEGLKWAFKAVEISENWAEGYLAIGKMFYFLANAGGPNQHRNWQRCVHFIRTGLSMPPTKTLLFVNPVEREFEIHKYLNVALNAIGDVKGALDSVNTGLQVQADPMLLGNRNLYEKFLVTQQITSSLDSLRNIGVLDDKAKELILSIVNNQNTIINSNNNYPDYKKSVTYPKDIADDQFPIAVITPHSQAWGIPNTLEIDDLPLRMTDEQLQAVVITIWKQYILHDEILAAESFLDKAPFNVRNSKITLEALDITRKMFGWLHDSKLMKIHNAPTDPNTEIDVPMPHPLLQNQSGGRFNWVRDNLPAHKISIVDFGCVDGCFTNRYAMMGHEVYGLDVVETSVALANKKAVEFNTGAKHIVTYFQDAENKVPNNYFDYATSTDTYEHLIDPVNDMLLPAKKMLNKNGKFLLCTPYGAWFRGYYVASGHPWLWAQEGLSWLCTKPRGHLVAPSPWSVVRHFKEAEYYVYNCYSAPSLIQQVKDQGNVFAEAYVKPPTNYPGLDIIFYIGDGVEEWTPLTIKKTGMGGSETAAYEMAKLLAARGHKVRVYNSCGFHGEGVYDGVEYYQSDKYQNLTCDVLLVSRRADMLSDKFNIQAQLKLLWVHDIYAMSATNELLLKSDRVLALSAWHKNNLIQSHSLHPDHILQTRNGINLERFNKLISRNKFKAINSSSPDRSWAVLLECWPKIKERVPQAELHLFYGFKNWECVAKFIAPEQMNLINFLKTRVKELEPLGVVNHDRVNQEQLAEEFLSAGCWIHPTWFSETSCITAMEAQAAGLRIVSSSIAALNETVADRGILIDGDWTTPEYKNNFINAVVDAMNKEDDSDRTILQQYAKDHFSWSDLSKDWENMFFDLLEKKKTNPLVPYQPTVNYQKVDK